MDNLQSEPESSNKAVPRGPWATGENIVIVPRATESKPGTSEFHMQKEDFPALPGALPIPDLMSQAPPSMVTAASDMLAATADSSSKPRQSAEAPAGILTSPDGDVSNIPPSMVADQFGMTGIVAYIRYIDDPVVASLALGYDLTTFGLNLNLTDNHLFTTFGGPYAENPVRPHELDVKVPEEYRTNAFLRDKLPPVKLNNMGEDNLFYLFYNCPGEVYQIAAACELYHRDWRYHMVEQVWLTRSQYGGIAEQTGTYEKGQYIVFDPAQWRKTPREMTLEYKDLEGKPQLPPEFNAAHPAGLNFPRMP